ncbi:MAG: transcription antitermination factor NusB [Acidobacteria bacterium]|nr:transcription antitermination factor NusB [Acidobacteriota bacterium]
MTAGAERRAAPRAGKDARRRAREVAVQMLYQWEVGRSSIDEVLQTFWLHDQPLTDTLPEEQRAFAAGLAGGVVAEARNIDPVIAEAAEHWRLERMNVLDRLILRLAVYEFLHRPDTPARVIINEALELARTFSNDDAVRFVNGVLDAIRRRLGRE